MFHSVYVPHSHYPPLVVGHFGCCHFLAIVSKAAANMAEQAFVEEDVESFAPMPRNVQPGHTVD